MYHDVIEPGDTFPMKMRKMIMALSGIAGILVMFNVLYFTTKLRTNETRAIYYYSFNIPIVVILIGSWIYVKWTHTAPTWLSSRGHPSQLQPPMKCLSWFRRTYRSLEDLPIGSGYAY